MTLKQHTPTEKVVGGLTFYIRPFAAFKAGNIGTEIVSLLTPALAGVAPTLGHAMSGDDFDLGSMDVSSFAKALTGLSGDKMEKLLRKLLTDFKNISVDVPEEDSEGVEETKNKVLTPDLVDEIFCGSAQDMFVLAFEVVNVNFSGFFEKIGAQLGFRKAESKTTPTRKSTAN